jgi:hypothetical protein
MCSHRDFQAEVDPISAQERQCDEGWDCLFFPETPLAGMTFASKRASGC